MNSLFPKNKIFYKWGDFAYAFFWITVISGGILVIFYNPVNPWGSIQHSMVNNPFFNVIRDIHYFGANLFIVALILHFWDYLPYISFFKLKKIRWLGILLSIFTSFYLMISGFILKGDADSLLALDVFRGLMVRVPYIGKSLSLFFTGYDENLTVLYLQHSGIATVFTIAMIYEHSRRRWPQKDVFWMGMGIVFFTSLLWNTPVHMPYERIIKGPWYFVGFQEILHHLSHPEFFLSLLAFYFVLLIIFPYMKKKLYWMIFIFILFTFVLYIGFTIIALLFRGENWSWI